MNLKISDKLSLPTEFAGRRTAIFGISGSGKSNTATVLVEQLLQAGEQVVLIDPKGEGWGLLSTAAGKPSNLPVIVFGEPNGHVSSLSESHGSKLADFVVETGQSVVLSLLGFESDQSERRFVATFLRQLYRRKSQRGQPTRTLVVLDEAHLFVPENPRGDNAEIAGAVQRIVRQGRSFGLGTLIVDQRPQDVSKRAITQCDSLICHQLVHKTDRDALRDWVRGYDRDGQGEAFLESLAMLEPGEAWIWSPAWLKIFQRVKVHRRKTFDSGAAPDGTAAAKTVQRADIDLEALRGQLAEIVDKAKADDPKELRKRIAELERQVREAPAKTADPVEVSVITDGQIAAMKELVDAFRQSKKEADHAWSVFDKCGEVWQKAIDHMTNRRAANEHPKIFRPNRTPARPSPAPVKQTPTTNGANGIKKSLQRALDAVAFWKALGFEPVDRKRACIAAGLSPRASTFGVYVSELIGTGYLNGENGGLMLTELGNATAVHPKVKPTPESLIQHARGLLGAQAARVFDAVCEAYPEPISRDDLADKVGLSRTASTLGVYLSESTSIGIVENVRGSGVRVADWLFPE